MKKIISIMLCITFLISNALPCAAATEPEIVSYKQTRLSHGLLCTETLTLSSVTPKATQRTATKKQSFSCEGISIADISITVTFRYDGSSVSVVSKEISQCDTYDGWSFTKSSFSSSSGSATLTGSLKKSSMTAVSVNISLKCDKNGNITKIPIFQP